MSKIKATEMSDAKVEYISLVKRGANRLPFRVLKSDTPKETPMLDLNNLGQSISRALKGETAPTGPVVVGVATMAKEGPELEAVKKSLEAHGYKTDDVQSFEDGSTVFKQEGELPAEHQIVRLSENVALVMKSFAPYSDDLSNDFVAAVKAKGFYDSVRTATNVFSDALYDLLYKSDSPSDASATCATLMSDFQSYVKGLISDLPSKAFKMEQEISVALTSAKKSEADGAGEPLNKQRPNQPGGLVGKAADGTPEFPVEQPGTPKVITTVDADGNIQKNTDVKAGDLPVVDVITERREDVSPGQSQVQDLPVPEDKAPVDEAGKATKAEGDALAKVLEGMTALTLLVQKGEQGRVEFEQKITERVDGIARKSEDAIKAVNSTVLGTAGGEDVPSQDSLVQKKEVDTDPRTGLFDTAFLPRANR